MRSRRTSTEHQQAVNHRLALLSAELSAVRPEDAYAAWVEEAEAPAADGTPWWDGHTRIAPGRGGSRETQRLRVVEDPAATPPLPPPMPPPLPQPVPPPFPVPGRHAARRRASLWPDTLRGRVLLGPTQVAVVALLAAAGLAATCWWLVRGDAEPGTPVSTSPAGGLVSIAPAVDATAPPAPPAAAPTPATVTVDVAGKVRRPGIAVLDAGSRVVDAIEAAGGARPGVDLTELNLARVLVDGEQVVVGVPPPTGAAAAAAPSPGATAGPLVNLNTAGSAELETLPEVGPVTAEAILAWRDQHGGFTSVDELLEVDGIGDATLARIAPHVTV